MTIRENNIPRREIEEQEEELLDEIWKGLPEGNESDEQKRWGFADLQLRIQNKIRQRRIYRFTVAGGVAAVVAVCFLLFRGPGVQEPEGVYAQLKDMGVAMANQRVVLKVDNAVVMQLDSAAKIETHTQAWATLRAANGTKLKLAKEKKLRIEVPAGCRFDLVLADGSRVWLNASSALEYPATFDGCAERRVRLEGEAFFEVQRDTATPFLVEIGKDETIRVLGTGFNVTAYPDAEEHTTTLATGKICYTPGAGREPLILVPNQQVCLNCSAGTTELRPVDASVYTSWKDGWIWFEDEKLEHLAARLARLYGIGIQVADKYKDYCFSGKIRFERGIDYITKLLTETTGITCSVDAGVIKLE